MSLSFAKGNFHYAQRILTSYNDWRARTMAQATKNMVFNLLDINQCHYPHLYKRLWIEISSFNLLTGLVGQYQQLDDQWPHLATGYEPGQRIVPWEQSRWKQPTPPTSPKAEDNRRSDIERRRRSGSTTLLLYLPKKSYHTLPARK